MRINTASTISLNAENSDSISKQETRSGRWLNPDKSPVNVKKTHEEGKAELVKSQESDSKINLKTDRKCNVLSPSKNSTISKTDFKAVNSLNSASKQKDKNNVSGSSTFEERIARSNKAKITVSEILEFKATTPSLGFATTNPEHPDRVYISFVTQNTSHAVAQNIKQNQVMVDFIYSDGKVQLKMPKEAGIGVKDGDSVKIYVRLSEDAEYIESGEAEKRTMTDKEFEELNSKFDQLLISIKSREENDAHPTKEKKSVYHQDNKVTLDKRAESFDFSTQSAKNDHIKEAIVMNALIEEGRRTERQRNKDEQAKDDEVTTIRDSVIRTENLKSDLKKRGIQDSELGVEPLNPVMRQKILSKKQTSVRAHRGL